VTGRQRARHAAASRASNCRLRATPQQVAVAAQDAMSTAKDARRSMPADRAIGFFIAPFSFFPATAHGAALACTYILKTFVGIPTMDKSASMTPRNDVTSCNRTQFATFPN